MMFRALEHQVLEEMGKASPPGALVLRSNVVPDVHRNDGDLVRFVDNDVEAVVEGVLGEG
jgi:hypothetical protein